MAIDSLSKCWEDNYKNKPGYHVSKIVTKPVKLKEDGNVRIVCISDTHSLVENNQPPFDIPDGDILIHAGDFTNQGNLDKVMEFNSWLGSLPHRHKVVIAGNHDLTFDYTKIQRPELQKAKSLLTNCIYLEDSDITIEGPKIYGTPRTPLFGHHLVGFMISSSDTQAWEELCSKIPSDTDILITHGPPLGILDANTRGEVCGSEELLRHVVERVKPKYHIFGHIHESYGVVTNGSTVFANAATCNIGFPMMATNPPHVFDIPRSEV